MMKIVVLCCVVAAAAARAPYFAPAALPVLLQPYHNYRGPLSLAPGQPANILAADGRPLDTLDVNLDRSAHFVAKVVDSGSRLTKRSVTRLAVAPGPVGFSSAVAAGNVGIVAPVAGPSGLATGIATNPVALSVPFVSSAFGINPFVAGPIGLSAPISTGPLGVSAGAVGVSGVPLVRNF